MGHEPILTVGMPVFNGERYLAEALDSVLSQTVENLFVLICDNASTDATLEISRRYAQMDSRITIHTSESNRGAAWNYNRAFEACATPYFMWLAHDDRLKPNFVAQALALLDERPEVVLASSPARFIDAEGAIMALATDEIHVIGFDPVVRFRQVLVHFRAQGYCNPVFGIFRTQSLRRTGLIGAFPSSDMILLAEAALHGAIVPLNEVQFERREHAGRSVRSHPSYEERAEWFRPGSGGKRQYITVRWWLEYVRAVERSDLSVNQRVKCNYVLAREFMPAFAGIFSRELRRLRALVRSSAAVEE